MYSSKKFLPEAGWKSLLILCFLIIGIRLIFTGIMGIMPQDAYYYFYASHLDLSYYDHPPMIAYLFRFFTGFLVKYVLVIKLAIPSQQAWPSSLFISWQKNLLSEKKALIATALLLSTLMVSILSLVSTPDVPLIFCWILSLNFLYEAIFDKKNIYWIWAGFMTGLSFDSKYTGIFILIGIIGFLLIAKPYRKLVFSVWFFLILALFCNHHFPVVIWNIRNRFASFKFQSEGRVKEGIAFDPRGFAGVVGHQSAILLPLLFFSFVYFIFRICKKYGFRFARIRVDLLFLLCFFIPLFIGIFCAVVFLLGKNKLDDSGLYHRYYLGSRYWNKKWLGYQLIFSLILHVAMAVEIIFYIVPGPFR